MPSPVPGTLLDTFILRFTTEAQTTDAEIALVSITVNPIGSGSQSHFAVIKFTYITGDPPATGFDVMWTSDRAGATLPTIWGFVPTAPAQGGDPAQIRTAQLNVWVPTPTQTTTFTGRITIRQQ